MKIFTATEFSKNMDVLLQTLAIEHKPIGVKAKGNTAILMSKVHWDTVQNLIRTKSD